MGQFGKILEVRGDLPKVSKEYRTIRPGLMGFGLTAQLVIVIGYRQ